MEKLTKLLLMICFLLSFKRLFCGPKLLWPPKIKRAKKCLLILNTEIVVEKVAQNQFHDPPSVSIGIKEGLQDLPQQI